MIRVGTEAEMKHYCFVALVGFFVVVGSLNFLKGYLLTVIDTNSKVSINRYFNVTFTSEALTSDELDYVSLSYVPCAL
jgi:hypothetical protein